VPVRFIMACDHGHLDEFPWHRWVNHEPVCSRRSPLRLSGEGAGLRGLVLSCTGCHQRRSMDGAFSREAMVSLGVRCAGKRPWLPTAAELCQSQHPPMVVQRGASNLYFPDVQSALDIPPWTDDVQEALGHHWANIVSADTQEDRDKYIEKFVWPAWEGPDITLERLAAKIRQRIELLDSPARPDLRWEEYLHLTSDEKTGDEHREFSLRPDKLPSAFIGLIGHLARVVRLREVRAIKGFTRIHPPSGDERMAKLSVKKKTWLPAIEVRGEGIFIALNERNVSEWEVRKDAQARAKDVDDRHVANWRLRTADDSSPPFRLTARFMLVHTLAHALMRQLSLECGYSTSALRERLYVDGTAPGMCGVLIYTSTSDADGTLGGLVRQGAPKRMEPLLKASLKAIEWCSNDPLCSKGINSLSEGMNLAACHSCVLAPETSCEHFNRFLDRAMLIGEPGNRGLGFFSPLLAEE
jgi:hypothetical protein